ncbi:hypothetical protein CGLO_09051 [Colletotrichum gloeosporioides Cg-14]|nr:hypothetical protein CGLO_09051 [Colletotrichum gloeosporioides Cg-14]
MSLDAQ